MHKGRIAVIDDEAFLVRLMADLLGREGFDVDAYESASDALKELVPHLSEYSCIITDFDMPDISGLDFAAKIREISFDVPIVLSSGDQFSLNEEQMQKLRISTILTKPFTRKDLIATIEKSLNYTHHSA